MFVNSYIILEMGEIYKIKGNENLKPYTEPLLPIIY